MGIIIKNQMKNIFAVSVLAATALAGYGPMTKSHH